MLKPIQWQARAIQLLSVPGIVIAFYLLLFHNEMLAETACQSGSFWDCGSVSGPDAPYAELAGIPVALLGLLGYIAMFLLVWLSDFVPLIRHNLRELLTGVVSLALLFTGYLSFLEAFVVQAWCQYCVYSAIVVFAMFVLAAWQLVDSNAQGDTQ